MLKNTYITLLVHILLVLLFSISTLEHIKSQSIDHCGAMEKHNHMLENDPEYQKNRKVLEREIKQLKNGVSNREQDLDGIITIPVVFHVIHNGDAIGTNAIGEDNENLPDFILEDQVQQLNEDFRRTSGYPSYTPQAFLDIAADVEVEFCIAAVDEYGDFSTGIIRHDINDLPNVSEDSVWTGTFIDTYIKQATIWDNTKYLNIWVVKKIEYINNGVVSNTVLGYAQFPGGPQDEDGIVLRSTIVGGPDHTNYTYGHPIYVGTDIPNPLGYRRGRTGTHEVGHYLNLYHIWGDGDCSETDMVDDTPNAEESTSSLNDCETFNNTCVDSPIDHPNMHQNHMDYGNGDCKMIFTADQKTRMLNSIMISRPGLITSSCQQAPYNDLFSNASYLECETSNENWGTFNATSSDSPDACSMAITNPGVWFEVTGDDNVATVSFCNSDYPPSVNVYKYVNGELACVPSTINYCTDLDDPIVTFNAAGYCSYYIYVSVYSGNAAASSLNISLTCEDVVCPSSTKIYVDKAYSGCGDGSSWSSALTDLQEALDRSSACGIDTIIVAGGTYYPTSSPDDVSTDPRDRAFHLNTDVVVIGGYDPNTNTQTGGETILSGDISVLGDAADNTYHVMVNTGLTPLANFQKITFSDGNANGTGNISYGGTTFNRRYGGGIYNKSSDPIYSNCVFTNNQATLNGGGLYITSSDATIIDCDFTSNTAANGGGIGNAYSSSSTISNSTFRSNIATSTGGGVANIFSARTIITNCVLVENEADNGGGIANSGTTIDIINCSLTANSTTNSAALFATTTTNISNTILWGNGNEISGTVMINNSIIEDGYTGCNDCPNVNGDIDPLFVNAADPDGQDNILGTADDGLNFTISSQAINNGNAAGAPSMDITGAIRIGNPDIGAYEAETCHDNLVFVSASAMGNSTGISWEDAFNDLQAALDQAMDCGVDSILVAEGIYYPTSSPDESTANPRDKAFHINTDVVLEGGYDPLTGTQTGSATILSGDIGVANDASDNAYHIMVNTGLTNAAVLENLTFRDGNADETGSISYGGQAFNRGYGGGIYSKFSNPIYSNCVFINNTATENGGGLYLTSSDATVNDCLFRSNSADNGGGLGNAWSSSSTISRSIFDSNIALSSGGGMTNIISSQTTITNCVFIDNLAVDGGGIANSGTSTDIINCTITSNSASGSGGSILSTSTTNITNSISWGNGSEIDGSVMINNSIVEGGYTGCVDCPNSDGNIDPLFVDAADPDGLDNIMGTSDDGINLMISSQAINAGSSAGAPSTDITGADRTGIPDIGAYEKETCHDNLVFVSASALGNNTGSSWSNAFNDLQDALDQAMYCGVDSILVAEGTYYPTSSPDESSTDPRDRAFHLNTNVVIKGGYDPLTGNQDGEATILSGDIGIPADSLDNTFHVMITTGLDVTTVLDQLTFMKGNANLYEESMYTYSGKIFRKLRGGGMYNISSSPTLSDCTFTSNVGFSGGGMYNMENASPILNNCVFESNIVIDNAPSEGYGAGMCNLNSSPILSFCTFTSNLNDSNGGGISNRNSSPQLTNCIFTSNTAQVGGGMYNDDSDPAVNNCTFKSNIASGGGGMFNRDSDPVVNNCTFMSNTANGGGGIYNWLNSSAVLTHCTFISNTAAFKGGGLYNRNMSMVSLTDCTFYVPMSNEGILNEANSTATINGKVEIINNYVTDNEGNPYKTIQIGNQNWMAENLNIGAMIDGIENQTDNATIEKYCYDNNPANCDIYGGLYQWDEMMQYVTTEGTQGACPTGWHLPSDDEFKTLEMTLGMTQAEADMSGNRGTDQGGQLAGNEPLWTNGALDQSAAFGSSGFVLLPSAKRTSNGTFNSIGNETSLWSSTELDSASAWYRYLTRLNDKVNRNVDVKGNGFSVRCVQD